MTILLPEAVEELGLEDGFGLALFLDLWPLGLTVKRRVAHFPRMPKPGETVYATNVPIELEMRVEAQVRQFGLFEDQQSDKFVAGPGWIDRAIVGDRFAPGDFIGFRSLGMSR